jgi:hypothetical protein
MTGPQRSYEQQLMIDLSNFPARNSVNYKLSKTVGSFRATGLEHGFTEPGLSQGQSGLRRSPGHR